MEIKEEKKTQETINKLEQEAKNEKASDSSEQESTTGLEYNDTYKSEILDESKKDDKTNIQSKKTSKIVRGAISIGLIAIVGVVAVFSLARGNQIKISVSKSLVESTSYTSRFKVVGEDHPDFKVYLSGQGNDVKSNLDSTDKLINFNDLYPSSTYTLKVYGSGLTSLHVFYTESFKTPSEFLYEPDVYTDVYMNNADGILNFKFEVENTYDFYSEFKAELLVDSVNTSFKVLTNDKTITSSFDITDPSKENILKISAVSTYHKDDGTKVFYQARIITK